MLRRLIVPLARLSLVASVVLTTGGCCRCWWPGPTPSSDATSTGGESPGVAGGLDGGDTAPPTPGLAAKAPLSYRSFAADPGAPLHGSLLNAPRDLGDPLCFDPTRGKQRRFVPHSATSAAAMWNGEVVVEANTGIWSHAPGSLARGALLVPPPVLAMAASPDGHFLAYARGAEGSSVASLHVISYPDGKPVASFPRVDRPFRLRFSPDGKRLVLASRKAETVTLVDLASKRVLRFDTGDDVNDAIVLPGDGDRVAYANDGDEAVILTMPTHAKLFSTSPFMREASGVLVPSLLGNRQHLLTMTRDQNAVAFDPLGGAFFAGGDDNKIWRFHGAIGPSPVMAPPIEVGGNVEEILCTHKPAPGQTEASVIVALDTLGIEVITPDGNRRGGVEAIGWSLLSSPIRIALTADDEVLAVLGGALARFNPADGTVKPSSEYPRFLLDWHVSVTEHDTVLATRGVPAFLHRVVHTAETADVATTVVGTIALDPAGIAAFSSGTRVLFGPSTEGHLALVYYVPSSGTIEPPLEVLGGAFLAGVARRKDGSAIGLLDADGHVFEVAETPRGAARVGRARSPLPPTAHLAWDEPARRWVIADAVGAMIPIDSP